MKEYNWDQKPDTGQNVCPEKDTQKSELEGSKIASSTHGQDLERQRVKTPELRKSGLQSSAKAEGISVLFGEAIDEPQWLKPRKGRAALKKLTHQ